jgi:hypothetical protein
MQKPPGARQRYDGRLSTPSACFRSVQVLTAFSRFDCWTNIFSLRHGIQVSRNVPI